jgi:hypothetical protein
MTDLYNVVKRIWSLGFVLQLASPLVFANVQSGVQNQLWASSVPRAYVGNGEYFMPVGKTIGGIKYSQDDTLAERLWQ